MNADCSGFKTNKFAKGFNIWRNKKEEGSFGTDADVGRGDSFSVRLDNMVRGCVIAYADVFAPGKTILVRLHAKGDNPHATVYYTKDRKWRFSLGNARVKFDEPSADGWRAGYAVVSIPHGADGFGVQMCGSAKGKVWYDDIGAYLIR